MIARLANEKNVENENINDKERNKQISICNGIVSYIPRHFVGSTSFT